MADPSVEAAPVGFVLTPELIQHVKLGQITGSSIALILSLLVCLVSLFIYSVPDARHHLDRVSFRLLLWSMVVEVAYNIDFIIATNLPNLNTQAAACNTTIYILLSTMGTANWLCTCIGVNLMLAISFSVNSIQAKLERWYVFGSFALGFIVPLAPAILKHFGPDPVYGVCYFTQSDKTKRIRDFVLDLYLWQLLSCAVAAGSVAMVLATLYRQSRATHRAMLQGHDLTITPSDIRSFERSQPDAPNVTMSVYDSPESDMSHKEGYLSPMQAASAQRASRSDRPTRSTMSCVIRRLLPYRQRTDHHANGRRQTASARRRSSQLHRLEDKLVTIALKISLYPLALLLINVVITSEDLRYSVRGGLYTQGDYAFFWLHNFLYAGRGIFFALLGIFVDPCLRLGFPAALRAVIGHHSKRDTFANSADESDHYSNEPCDPPTPGPGPGPEPWNNAQTISDFLSTDSPDSLDFAQFYASKPRWQPAPVVSNVYIKGNMSPRAQQQGTSRSPRDIERGLSVLEEGVAGDVTFPGGWMDSSEAASDSTPRTADGQLNTSTGRASGSYPISGGHQNEPAPAELGVRILSPTIAANDPSSVSVGMESRRHRTFASNEQLRPPSISAQQSKEGEVDGSRDRDRRDWVEQLAIAVRTDSRGSGQGQQRRGSDPLAGLSVAQRRRRDLQIAAEEMYAQAQKAL